MRKRTRRRRLRQAQPRPVASLGSHTVALSDQLIERLVTESTWTRQQLEDARRAGLRYWPARGTLVLIGFLPVPTLAH